MSRRDVLLRWPIVLLLLLLISIASSLVVIGLHRHHDDVDSLELYKRWSAPISRIQHDPGLGGRDPGITLAADSGRSSAAGRSESGIPEDLGIAALKKAAAGWKRSAGTERVIVDQICLVPDVITFMEAIAAWDERHFYPILIDEPAWTLPFTRAFQPERVIRLERRKPAEPDRARPDRSAGEKPRQVSWLDGVRAVSRAWSRGEAAGANVVNGQLPSHLGHGAPGIVLTSADSPMFAGAVALAAGRFQPLLRFDPSSLIADAPLKSADILTATQAWELARAVEQRVAALGNAYETIGDACDFLTIAGDWPYRYLGSIKSSEPPAILALDDLLGRVLVGDPDGDGIRRSRRRWAYAGRLIGSPAASVAHAMSALFLHPQSALLWNTYGDSEPWNIYTMRPAAKTLRARLDGSAAIQTHSKADANLNSWHHAVGALGRFGLIMINTTGGPRDFTIAGGPGHPADIPLSVSTVVSTIHSFSAAEPSNTETIAGRWLEQGAYAYYGSVNEPFVQAFRPPSLIADLIVADVPLVAAVRQGEYEPFGQPWRLMYLGDPLYRVLDDQREQSGRSGNQDYSHRGRIARLKPPESTSADNGRPEWRYSVMDQSESTPPAASSRMDAVLAWCQTMAIQHASRSGTAPLSHQPSAWIAMLEQMERDQLPAQDRDRYDQILIDSLIGAGRNELLWTRLCRIPAKERGPRVWHALEYISTSRLAHLLEEPAEQGQFPQCADLWERVITEAWPTRSAFPEQFTKRVHAAASNRPARLAVFADRLKRVSQRLVASPDEFAHANMVESERGRVSRELGQP